ncbi:hypothetical protein OG921_15995 [Aldersonia sp. NBC_00410]|nr:hypothetical protein [Aldersonia sp. NBC_00410]MCX5044669.1 hypothetical protein [Aldersonia sp. NBC_00410]
MPARDTLKTVRVIPAVTWSANETYDGFANMGRLALDTEHGQCAS